MIDSLIDFVFLFWCGSLHLVGFQNVETSSLFNNDFHMEVGSFRLARFHARCDSLISTVFNQRIGPLFGSGCHKTTDSLTELGFH